MSIKEAPVGIRGVQPQLDERRKQQLKYMKYDIDNVRVDVASVHVYTHNNRIYSIVWMSGV